MVPHTKMPTTFSPVDQQYEAALINSTEGQRSRIDTDTSNSQCHRHLYCIPHSTTAASKTTIWRSPSAADGRLRITHDTNYLLAIVSDQ